MKAYPEVTVIPSDDNLCWSSDAEDFSAQSLGELLDQAGGPIGPIVYLADREPFEISEFMSADRIIGECLCLASNDCEAADTRASAIDVSDAAIEELQSLLNAWAAKHLPPMNIYRPTNIRQYTLTEDDVIE